MALDLSGKIAGIPVPVIGGVIGLGIVAVFYFQSAGKSAAAAPTTIAMPDLGPGDQVDSTGQGNDASGSGGAMFTSNATWMATALGGMVTTMGLSPLKVQQIIGKYLDGETLTYEEGQIMDQIIAKYGLPPQGVTGNSVVLDKVKIPLKDPEVDVPVAAPATSTPASAPVYVPPVTIPSNYSMDHWSVANRAMAAADPSQSWSNGVLGINPIIDWSLFQGSSSSVKETSAAELAQRERDKAAGW